jgi:ABC-type polysaccharide/polyol phosphate export permease
LGLLQHIYIPRASFGLSAIRSDIVNLVLSFVPLIIVMAVTGVSIQMTAAFLSVSLLLLVRNAAHAFERAHARVTRQYDKINW